MPQKTPTPIQQKVIESEGKTILKSCPGSGKTFVVAKKMLMETFSWKYKNRGVALLSFTNVANDEVNKQIFQISNIRKLGYPHFIGTIDSFILQWLFLPFGYLIMGCSDRPLLLQDTSESVLAYANRIWRKECYGSYCVPLDFYFDLDGEIKNISKDISSCPVKVAKPCESFKRYCYKSGYATYTDATIIALKILQTRPDIGNILAKRFPKLIIDEAQDTSEYQMKIIDKLVEYGVTEIMIIGDPDQAIYEWRDADPSVFLDKYNNSSWNKRLLNENFRCSQKICDATKIFSSLENTSTAVGDSANAKFKPLVLRYNPKEKNRAIEEFMQICINEKINITPETVAVLVRGKTALFGKDYSQIKDLWQSRESRLLSEATYERDIGSLSKAQKLVEQSLFGIFVKQDFSLKDITPEEIGKKVATDVWRKIILDFIKTMPSANTQLNVWKTQIESLITTIATKYSFNRNLENYIKIKTRDMNCPDFLLQPVKSFYAKSNELEYLNSTIHGVKGRTFEAVMLLLSTTGKLTSNMINTYPINSEVIRTAYVAMTRAKRVLIVAIPNTIRLQTLVRFPLSHWDIKDLPS